MGNRKTISSLVERLARWRLEHICLDDFCLFHIFNWEAENRGQVIESGCERATYIYFLWWEIMFVSNATITSGPTMQTERREVICRLEERHVMDVNTKFSARLCSEMIRYCCVCNKKTHGMKVSEIEDHLRVFFTDEEIEGAIKIMTGEI